MRLDKCISNHLKCGKSDARKLIAQGLVWVNGKAVRDNLFDVSKYCTVICDGKKIQGEAVYYIMLNKPAGCVSATVDDEHQTVIDLIKEDYAGKLHIAGRLDKASTGLLILTNDGIWSRYLTEPIMEIPKRYLVTTESDMTDETVEKFKAGFYFAFEDVTTLPADLEIHSERSATVTIYEGKYHQIKRMFHAVGNRITSLHRLSIGCLALDQELKPGEYRCLTANEIAETKSLYSE